MTTSQHLSLHKADSRGFANHGWLQSFHTFSFAGYHNESRMHFGAIRVLNDDTVAAGMGFGTHSHDNMEIISIPTFGDLRHKDSMGNETVIKQGDIQVMSAGTGISHSEMNANRDKEVRFFQIWIYPNKKNITPRYDQQTIDVAAMQNNLLQILSPHQEDGGVWIHQDAWFSMGQLEAGFQTSYSIKKQGNGVYAFVVEGSVTINDQPLNKRDGLGVAGVDRLLLTANTNATILLMEVPML